MVPFSPLEMSLPAEELNADDTAWFKLAVDPTSNPTREQTLRFLLRWSDPSRRPGYRTWLNFSVYGDGDITMPLFGPSGPGSPERPGAPADLLAHITRLLAGPRTLFLAVTRTDDARAAGLREFGIDWETNLKILHGKQVAGQDVCTNDARSTCDRLEAYCGETTDENFLTCNHDEIVSVRICADGQLFQLPLRQNVCNGGRVAMEERIPPIAYVDRAAIALIEDDDPGSSTIPFPWIPEMAAGTSRQLAQRLRYCEDGCDEVDYTLNYNLSRFLPVEFTPVGGTPIGTCP